MNNYKVAVLIFSLGGCVFAQPANTSPTFDVATIRGMADRPDAYVKPIRSSPDTLKLNFLTLGECIAWAYQMQESQIYGEKLTRQHYEIVAKAASPVATAELRAMLRSLLAERFHLVVHHDSRVMSVYALLPGKKPKLELAEGDGEMSRRTSAAGMAFDHTSMFDLADIIASEIGTPVVDLTGFTGLYKFTLVPPAPPTSATDEPLPRERFSFFASASDQLGLDIQKRKAAIDVLVVDHFESPSEN